mmetsp:Transcript_113825/g.328737  ORF Transcript_113825/g.328737 Transcript_113825/m.328737 type:complete len:336 (-) Transcript_113825:1386-2393(-)
MRQLREAVLDQFDLFLRFDVSSAIEVILFEQHLHLSDLIIRETELLLLLPSSILLKAAEQSHELLPVHRLRFLLQARLAERGIGRKAGPAQSEQHVHRLTHCKDAATPAGELECLLHLRQLLLTEHPQQLLQFPCIKSATTVDIHPLDVGHQMHDGKRVAQGPEHLAHLNRRDFAAALLILFLHGLLDLRCFPCREAFLVAIDRQDLPECAQIELIPRPQLGIEDGLVSAVRVRDISQCPQHAVDLRAIEPIAVIARSNDMLNLFHLVVPHPAHKEQKLALAEPSVVVAVDFSDDGIHCCTVYLVVEPVEDAVQFTHSEISGMPPVTCFGRLAVS